MSILKWFSSSAGKSVITGAAAVGISVIGYSQPLLHGVLVDKYRSFMQMYRSGIEVPVEASLTKLAEQVLLDMKMSQRDKDRFRFFTVSGMDVFNAGGTKLRNGAVIGIPYNFRYECDADVETSLIKIGKEESEINSESPTGKTLINSIVFSKSAKQFAIAREINSSMTYRKTITGLCTSFGLGFGYSLGYYINNKYDMINRLTLRMRIVLYTLCGAIGLVTCLMLNDAVNLYYDSHADKAAAQLGREYAVGGVEYYEKLVARNKALRKILGEDGEKYYTAGGNFNSWIRTKSLPPVARLDNLRLELENYSVGEAKGST